MDDLSGFILFIDNLFWDSVGKENIPSVAYLSFKNEECLAAFSKEYDGHHFRDKQGMYDLGNLITMCIIDCDFFPSGNDSFAIVEFAPNPKVPPEKKKVDPRHATVQQGKHISSNLLLYILIFGNLDEDYLSFAASLQNPPEKHEVDMDTLRTFVLYLSLPLPKNLY